MDGLNVIAAALWFQNAPTVYRANWLSVILKVINVRESLSNFSFETFLWEWSIEFRFPPPYVINHHMRSLSLLYF
jgi:hypothetical protein